MARLTLIFVALVFMALPAQVALGGTSTGCGTVLVAGSSWLGGEGVDVKSNGTGWVGSCRGGSAGWGYQCVDLAVRLYTKLGWGRVYAAGNGGAAYIPEGSKGLEFHPNGTFAPRPGDLIIESPTKSNAYGHVAVVDAVAGTTIHAVEQNTQYWDAHSKSWVDHPRHTYTLHGLSISGGYGSVRGVMHSPKNHLGQAAAPTPTPAPTPQPTPAPAQGWLGSAIASIVKAAEAAAAAHPTPAPAPTPAAASGAVFRLTSAVNLRAGPGTAYRTVGTLPAGHAVTISCQALGTPVGGSSIWDELASGGWVTDYYVSTPRFNAFTAGIRRC